MGSSCVHRCLEDFGLKWPEMDTAGSVISRRHHPRKRMIQHASGGRFDVVAGVYWTPAFAGYDGITAACFPGLLAPNRGREIGGGRATRQPGQVRKEAALTRSGSGRSSVSYLFFERIAQKTVSQRRPLGLVPPNVEKAGTGVSFRKSRPRDNQLRIDR